MRMSRLLQAAVLKRAVLTRAALKRPVLKGAVAKGAMLKRTVLNGAILNGAILKGAVLMVSAVTAQAALQEEPVSYRAGGITFEGFLVYDDAIEQQRPGLLVVHEWWGLNDYARQRARLLAEQGYTALAVDMYGEGKSTSHPKEATAMMQQATADMASFRARFVAAKELLEKHPTVDAEKISALGYCFGGMTVLNMAREGVDLDLVASFHGLLSTQSPAREGDLKAKVLVFNGAQDPMVPAADIAAFQQEMETAKVDYELKNYPDATHGFTNPSADELGRLHDMPLAYDQQADRDSWDQLLSELEQVYSK